MGVDAMATYNPETKECVVLKGSKVSKTISQAPTNSFFSTYQRHSKHATPLSIW